MWKCKWYAILFSWLSLLLVFLPVACSQPPATTEESPQEAQPASLKPAEFKVGPITFEPSIVMVGDSVSITATIKNIGDIAGTYTAAPSIDGQVIDSRDISILPGQSSVAVFTVNNVTAGKHVIAIGESAISIDVSPKQTRIAFVRDFGDYYGWDICAANSDGTDIKRITKSASMDSHPVWSPDGTQIAFDSIREWHGEASIYIMDADGGNVKCLTGLKFCRAPSWSPDGKEITYCVFYNAASGASGAPNIWVTDAIYIMDNDGGNKQYVTRGWYPSWFPDGQRVALFLGSSSWVIVCADTDGSNTKEYQTHPALLAPQPYLPSCPANYRPALSVSPDGKLVAFDDDSKGYLGIYVMSFDDGKVSKLIGSISENCYCPTWSPDGSKIAFTLEKDGNTDIYTINADGSNPTLLIENGMYPSWQR